jgi:hypothetical protein
MPIWHFKRLGRTPPPLPDEATQLYVSRMGIFESDEKTHGEVNVNASVLYIRA